MRKIIAAIFTICLILVFTFAMVDEYKTKAVEPETETTNCVGNYYKINGEYKNVGDYMETEELLLGELSDKGINIDKVYDSCDLTEEILINRKGTTILERCIGMVVDKNAGDGVILNENDKYNYISYRSCEEKISDGTILVSYMLYSPDNNYIDDIIERYDFVLTREYED